MFALFTSARRLWRISRGDEARVSVEAEGGVRSPRWWRLIELDRRDRLLRNDWLASQERSAWEKESATRRVVRESYE